MSQSTKTKPSTFRNACDDIDETFRVLSAPARQRIKNWLVECMSEAYRKGRDDATPAPYGRVAHRLREDVDGGDE